MLLRLQKKQQVPEKPLFPSTLQERILSAPATDTDAYQQWRQNLSSIMASEMVDFDERIDAFQTLYHHDMFGKLAKRARQGGGIRA